MAVLNLAALGVLFYHFQVSQAQGAQYDLVGWLWSDNYGWVSLSPDNCKLPDCASGARDYGVKLDSSDNFFGWAWAANVGWICWGRTCSGTTPDGAAAQAALDRVGGRVTGWAKIISLADDGWIDLSSQDLPGTVVKGQMCYDCEPKCLRWTVQCVGEGAEQVCENVEPCLEYSQTEFEKCNTCFSETLFCLPDGTCQQPAQALDPVAGGSGYICSNCSNECKKDPVTTERITCNNCSGCRQYGVSSEVSRFGNGNILGWAWNGLGSALASRVGGAGWLHFNTGKGVFVVYPWLETQYGSIYTSKEARQKAGAVSNNATYCIFAKDIKRIRSARCEERVITDVNINFPNLEAEQVYRNALGKLDVAGLVTKYRESGGRQYNKFGNEIVRIAGLGEIAQGGGSIYLDNKVYVTSGDLLVSQEYSFNNGAKYGNGTIVVSGDLIINSNINYNGGLTTDLKQLASAAWIVKGDVKIGGNVQKSAGAFIILGKDNTACAKEGGAEADYPRYEANHCGVLFSGSSNKALTIYGLAIARAFDFRRSFAKAQQGAERVIYDGRLVANPPAGLSGFTEKLPVIRDFAY